MEISDIISIISIIVSIVALIVSIIAVVYTRKQYRSAIYPELWTNGYMIKPVEKLVSFDISNRSHTARIIDIIPITPNIQLYQKYGKLDITKDDSVNIVCNFTGCDINKELFILKIKYQDKEGNKYHKLLKAGKGNLIIE